MSTHITLRQIEYFISVADTGQISISSSLCNVSQSSMTIALQKLEESLGVELLLRHAKGVRLSDAGERFLRHVQQASRSVEDAVSAAQEVPVQISGRVKVGMTDTISAYLLPSLVTSLRQRFSDLDIEVVERSREDIEEALIHDKLELALLLVSNVAPADELTFEVVLRSPRRLWTAPDHPLQAAERVTLEDVAKERFLLLDMDGHIATVNRYWGHYGLAPQVHIQSRSIEAVRSLVAVNHGVTILSDLVYRPWSLEGRRISRRDISTELPTMDIGAVWRKGHSLSPQARAFRHLLRSWKPLFKV
ncbi:LysR family transcriptional regulator [Burkholderia sp. Ax-1724]|uniref:LysR family transcriptional regulator n=1 Tax=Burkholderia sp. Ax-1724 TaxID=2608336 RepID=UPI00141E5510|nr:LysR family transcriptional regulator [Burkholderia sp. Ax-1724]NIF54308.1 LysR family transcriptional regulator [Burkholderia sp. Ax-1724]